MNSHKIGPTIGWFYLTTLLSSNNPPKTSRKRNIYPTTLLLDLRDFGDSGESEIDAMYPILILDLTVDDPLYASIMNTLSELFFPLVTATSHKCWSAHPPLNLSWFFKCLCIHTYGMSATRFLLTALTPRCYWMSTAINDMFCEKNVKGELDAQKICQRNCRNYNEQTNSCCLEAY